jgi:hypothetical protein
LISLTSPVFPDKKYFYHTKIKKSRPLLNKKWGDGVLGEWDGVLRPFEQMIKDWKDG